MRVVGVRANSGRAQAEGAAPLLEASREDQARDQMLTKDEGKGDRHPRRDRARSRRSRARSDVDEDEGERERHDDAAESHEADRERPLAPARDM